MKKRTKKLSRLKKFTIFNVALIAVFALALLTLRPLVMHSVEEFRCPINMVLVPGGKFQHGTTKEMLSYIVKLCKETFGTCYDDWFWMEYPRQTRDVEKYCIDAFEYPNVRGHAPLHGVDWNTANNKCLAQGKRLCTDNEWEKACAGDTGTTWPFGATYSEGACNLEAGKIENSGKRGRCRSRYGAYDMSGNVMEWTASTLVSEYADATDKKAPRLMKGGSYKDHPLFARCAYRDSYMPEYSYDTFGFRCCWPDRRK